MAAEEFWWVPGPQIFCNPDIATGSLLDIRQSPAGTSVIRIYSIYCFVVCPQSPPLTALNTFVISRISTPAQVGTIGIFPMRPTNQPLPSSVTAGSNRSYSEIGVFRQITRGMLAIANVSVPSDVYQDWALDIPMGLVWGTTLADGNVQPATIRAGEGFHIRQTATISGSFNNTLEVDMEFGIAST